MQNQKKHKQQPNPTKDFHELKSCRPYLKQLQLVYDLVKQTYDLILQAKRFRTIYLSKKNDLEEELNSKINFKIYSKFL